MLQNNEITPFAEFIDQWWIQDWDNIVLCDIDGTIFRDSLFLHIFTGLVELTGQYELLKIHDKYMNQWKDRIISYDEYLGNVIPMFIDLIQWVKQNDFENICYKAVEVYNNRTYFYTKNLLKDKISEGTKVFFVSGSPYEIVSYFAKINGFSWAIGSYYFSDEKNLKTGERIPLFSDSAKLAVLNYIKSKYKWVHIMWIGDTNGDFSLITQSDYWIAINPSRELAERLVENKNNIKNPVHIVIERKDLNIIMNLDILEQSIF